MKTVSTYIYGPSQPMFMDLAYGYTTAHIYTMSSDILLSLDCPVSKSSLCPNRWYMVMICVCVCVCVLREYQHCDK